MKSISLLPHYLFFLELLIFLLSNEGTSAKYEGGTITDDTLKLLLAKFQQIAGHHLTLLDKQIFINQSEIFLNASVNDGSLIDPSNFVTDLAHVNMPTMEFFIKVSYHSLSIKGKYSLYLDNEYIHMDSSDQLSIDIENMDVSTYMKLNFTKDQTLQMENFIIDYNMTIKVDIKNLGGNTEVSNTLNKLINEVTPGIIQSTKPDAQAIVKNIVFERSKFVIGGMTLQNFIDFVNNIVKDQ